MFRRVSIHFGLRLHALAVAVYETVRLLRLCSLIRFVSCFGSVVSVPFLAGITPPAFVSRRLRFGLRLDAPAVAVYETVQLLCCVFVRCSVSLRSRFVVLDSFKLILVLIHPVVSSSFSCSCGR